MSKQTDEYYLTKIAKGDTSAYRFLVDKYKDMVFHIALKIVDCRETAEEIAQDAFIKAFQALDTFKREAKFSTWIYRIVYNTAISQRRKNAVMTSEINEEIIINERFEETYNGLNALKEEQQREYIKKALTALTEEDNVIVSLFYLDDCSIDEIVEITGLSKSNVKIKLYRSRKKLYDELEKLLKHELHEIL